MTPSVSIALSGLWRFCSLWGRLPGQWGQLCQLWGRVVTAAISFAGAKGNRILGSGRGRVGSGRWVWVAGSGSLGQFAIALALAWNPNQQIAD